MDWFKKKRKGDYHFKCLDSDKYRLSFDFAVKDRKFMLVFEKSKKALMKKANMKLPETKSMLKDKFEVDPSLHKLLITFLNRQIREALAETKADGIHAYTPDIITRAYFEKDKELKIWKIHIMLKGIYVDKR